MTSLQAIILGIIQGIGEFLPISSSGHLIFLPKFFGWSDQGLTFDMVAHLGTLLAVIIYFREHLWTLITSIFTRDKKHQANRRLIWLIGVSTIPAGIIGFLFGDLIEQELRSPHIIGASLIVWGIVLGCADRYSHRVHAKRTDLSEKTLLRDLSWFQVMGMGLAQAVALIPGTSRSGITMTAGLFSGLSRKAASEFSFLMSIPIIGLAAGSKLFDVMQHGAGQGASTSLLVVGFLSAAISGFFAISVLMKIIQKWSFMPFVIYRIIVGVLILFFL